MRWFGFGLALAVLGGCSVPNPSFDGESESSPAQGTDAGSTTGGEKPTSSGLVTTDSVGPDDDTSTGDHGTGGESGLDTGSVTSGTGSGECVDHLFNPFAITLLEGDVQRQPNCEPVQIYGYVVPQDDSLQVTVCSDLGECGDECEVEATHTVAVGEDGAVPDFAPACMFVRVWAGEDEDGSCSDWDGFSVAAQSDGLPLVIGSNLLEHDEMHPDVLAAIDVTDAECTDGMSCSGPHRPGKYGIAVEGLPVWPDDKAKIVSIAGVDYDFDNRSSFVTDDCAENFSWWAHRR
jgi:hypothetical protein